MEDGGMEHVRGRVVLLGGATGEVGAEVARQLQEAGARLALAVRRPWQVEPLRARFGGTNVLVGCVGTSDSEAAAGFVKGAHDALGPVDALIATQGAYAFGPVGADPAGELGAMVEANLLAPANLARAVVGRFRRRRAGRLVFTGADAVGTGHGMANYLASKAALHEYARTLSLDLQDSCVAVAVAMPGILDTQKNRKAMPDADPAGWLPVPVLARFLVQLAMAPLPAGGPLYPVPRAG